MTKPYVLILYYSRHGATRKLAQAISHGVEQIKGIEARLRTVPRVSPVTESSEPEIPLKGDIYCSENDLRHCAALALGSPTRFGNMAAPLKYFIDSTASQWVNGDLIDKPAGVFTSTSSMHGGQESTLLSMMLPLIHHGMLIVGVPYSEDDLHTTRSGGGPYGVSHLASGQDKTSELTEEEARIAVAYGKRLANLATRLCHQSTY
ncbi:MAG: NAD(P)H-quinone oxidoreductase [Alteromonadaceae bacterium]|nr:MAG: NAD(P)H-quinone oxidoreductase [Alteromonadaceae bacterium]